MITSGPWQLYDLQTAKTPYGVVPLPGTDGDHQTVSGPDLWALFDHKDANRAHWSYEFTKWLTSAGAGHQVERRVRQPAAALVRGRSRRSSTRRSTRSPASTSWPTTCVNAKHARPTVPGYVGLSEAIGNAISEVLQGQGDPKPTP